MTDLDHATARRLIDAYLGGELEASQVEAMRDHLRDCDACRARYDARVGAEQRVLGGEEAGQLANRRVLESLLADPGLHAQRAPERRWWPAFILAPAAALAAALAFTLTLSPPDADPGLRARGADAGVLDVGLGVTAVDPRSGAIYDARRPEGVRLEHRLRFSYTNAAGPARYLFLLGVDDALRPYWYYPLPEEGQSVAIESGAAARQKPLPFETELRRRHSAGRIRVVALFSAHPVALEAVEEVLDRARDGGIALERIRWPGDPAVQILELHLRGRERP
jgi:hypothetical protein